MPLKRPDDIGDMVACAARELSMRQAVYPRRVDAGRMSQAEANKECERMSAILEFLKQVRDEVEPQGSLEF